MRIKSTVKEFKEEALKLSYEIGVKKAALQLGIRYCTITGCRKNRKAAEVVLKPALTDDEPRHTNASCIAVCDAINYAGLPLVAYRKLTCKSAE